MKLLRRLVSRGRVIETRREVVLGKRSEIRGAAVNMEEGAGQYGREQERASKTPRVRGA